MTYKKQFKLSGNGLLVRAPAKINLTLLIAGKRPDGFHEIETVMSKINWYDEIFIQYGLKPGIELVCKGPYWAPAGEENLVYRACKTLLEYCGKTACLKITLKKNVPAGTGLGSASSDAAATLIGVNRFLKLGISTGKLMKIAAKLGSDVAFFLNGPLALCTGKGEKIRKLSKNFSFSALLVIPDISVSTKRVYENYTHNGAIYTELNAKIKNFLRKNRIDLAAEMCANMLQISCFDIYKDIKTLKKRIESLGIGPLCLSGSGGVMYCIIKNKGEKKAEEYQRRLEEDLDCKSVIVNNNRW
jgi:4-diphosphocytidyl-2-C-methyl-D-erythritol kinase